MRIHWLKFIFIFIAILFSVSTTKAQHYFFIAGKVVDADTRLPLPSATVQLVGQTVSTLTRADGTFTIRTEIWADSLQITTIGYAPFIMGLQRDHTTALFVGMKNSAARLQEVTIRIGKKPGQSLLEKVIEHKPQNDPARFHSYYYRRYSRNELDLDQLDYKRMGEKGLRGIVASVYAGIDSNGRKDKELPIYFSETLADNYHSVSPPLERETILAKQNLGLKTDELLQRLEKFYFHFSVYDNWIPIFDQTYVSPLNDKALTFYNFFLGDTISGKDGTIRQIRFTPLHSYEKAFIGSLWINDSSFAVESVDMHLPHTVNLNFVKSLNYSEEYQQLYDSVAGKMAYMPSKYVSEVQFEAGLSLLGIPVPDNKESVQLATRSTTTLDKIVLHPLPAASIHILMAGKTSPGYDKPEDYWRKNRPDSLSLHEKNIYRMVDSLKENKLFQRNIKWIAFAGTGYWDIGQQLRLGPHSSFISHNPIEGWRVRVGFWTLPAIHYRLNFYGYGAYGLKDHMFKGGLGVKYVWNDKKWTKTTLWSGSDYDFIIDQHDELDKDNIISSFLRKKIPFTRTYIKQLSISHEQYLGPDWSALGSFGYRELHPVFDFSYHPINPELETPIDSISLKKLPAAEVSVGFRYAHHERTSVLNYDQLRLGSFSPVVTVSYTHGFELNREQFGYETHGSYEKVTVAIEQKWRLPPKSLLYYKLNAGKIFGMIPYLFLNIPVGNEYYVSSRYAFNTMTPYEFAADRYVSFHSRLSLGGTLFDKIPLLQKLGWRETVSFNGYWGDMTSANRKYNLKSNFNLVGSTPFLEGALGIDNIFHLLSIDYYRRFTHLGNPYARRDGIYLGLHLTF